MSRLPDSTICSSTAVGHHEDRDVPVEEVFDIGGIAAEEPVSTEGKAIAPCDVRGGRFDDRVVVGLPGGGSLAEESFELLGGPECIQVETVRLELLQDRGIPLEIQFTDPVVGDGQGSGQGVRRQIEIGAAHDHQLAPTRAVPRLALSWR